MTGLPGVEIFSLASVNLTYLRRVSMTESASDHFRRLQAVGAMTSTLSSLEKLVTFRYQGARSRRDTRLRLHCTSPGICFNVNLASKAWTTECWLQRSSLWPKRRAGALNAGIMFLCFGLGVPVVTCPQCDNLPTHEAVISDSGWWVSHPRSPHTSRG